LTTAHREALLPTALSRLRPYRFVARDRAAETEVIRRIFRDPRPPAFDGGALLRRYLDSFLPDSGEALHPLAALFAASVAMGAAAALRHSGADPGEALTRLGSRCAALAEEAGLGRPLKDPGVLAAKVLEQADKFEIRSRFSQFLRSLLALVGESLGASPEALACRDLWSAAAREAETAALTYNLSPAMVLERLIASLHRSLILQGAPRLEAQP
jgi:DNA polymerase-3 subunit gamma/tau